MTVDFDSQRSNLMKDPTVSPDSFIPPEIELFTSTYLDVCLSL